MTGPVSDDKDIARYASPSKINKKTGRPIGKAFLLRSEQEEYLSVYCLNMLPGDDIPSRVKHLKKHIPLETKATGRLGIINVGVMRKYVESESQDGRKLSVTHEPETGCEYHCGIKGLKYKDELIAELIAECVTECYTALAKPKISGC